MTTDDTPEAGALARLQDAIAGERRDWHTVEVRPDDIAALIAAARREPSAPHPGENHEFSTTCLRCGEPGMLHVSVITPNERVDISDVRPAARELEREKLGLKRADEYGRLLAERDRLIGRGVDPSDLEMPERP